MSVATLPRARLNKDLTRAPPLPMRNQRSPASPFVQGLSARLLEGDVGIIPDPRSDVLATAADEVEDILPHSQVERGDEVTLAHQAH